jgi:hypothetical protein
MSQGDGRSFLRHTLATLAYRCGKAIRDAPGGFEAFAAGPATRTPAQILAHIGDVIDWGLSIASGKERWHDSTPRSWSDEVKRCFAALEAFDAFLASEEPLAVAPEKLFQGPVADALTHVGQLAMLRRLAGGAVRGENYFQADIVAGRVGPEQAPPRREFD